MPAQHESTPGQANAVMAAGDFEGFLARCTDHPE